MTGGTAANSEIMIHDPLHFSCSYECEEVHGQAMRAVELLCCLPRVCFCRRCSLQLRTFPLRNNEQRKCQQFESLSLLAFIERSMWRTQDHKVASLVLSVAAFQLRSNSAAFIKFRRCQHGQNYDFWSLHERRKAVFSLCAFFSLFFISFPCCS